MKKLRAAREALQRMHPAKMDAALAALVGTVIADRLAGVIDNFRLAVFFEFLNRIAPIFVNVLKR